MDIYTLKQNLHNNINKVMAGCDDKVDLLLMCSLIKGHVLLEDVPGTGKTTLAKAFARSIDASFKRIQFTPDLLPSDITGVTIYQNNEFIFKKGPIFSSIILADEINRAAPRTQSSMLEAMEEFQISTDGNTYPLPDPFMVIATENPVENAGTFPLPEAQMDRFTVRLTIGYPDPKAEIEMLKMQSESKPLDSLTPVCTMIDFENLKETWQHVTISDVLYDYLMKIVEATRHNEKIVLGISPRASLCMVKCLKSYAALQGRDYVLPDDIKDLIHPVFDHRIILEGGNYTKSNNTTIVLDEILNEIPVPVENFKR